MDELTLVSIIIGIFGGLSGGGITLFVLFKREIKRLKDKGLW